MSIEKTPGCAELYRIVAQNGDSLPLMQRFAAARQAEMKLALAFYGFFRAEALTEPQRAVLGRYVQAHDAEAALALIELGQIDALERLFTLGWLTPPMLDGLLRTALARRQTEILIWLLHLKDTLGGYSDRDFSFREEP